jgi:hypothetical protein
MYKVTKKLIFLTLLSLLISTTTSNNSFLSNSDEQIKQPRNLVDPGARCIIIYEHCGYAGAYQQICADQGSFSISFGVSGIKVASNTVATLYSQTNYSGQSLELSSNTDCLTGDYNFNDIAKSVKLRPSTGCVWMYTDCNYSGTEVEYCSNNSNVGSTYNDKYSSALIGAYTSVKMFQDSNYGGSSYTISSDNSCFTGIGFNDKLTSLTISVTSPKQGCVWLYTDVNYGGNRAEFCSDISNMSTYGYNDAISSIKAGPNTYVVLYENSDYQGSSYQAFESMSLLSMDFNDKASSLRIHQTLTLKDQLEAALQKYAPYYWLHSDEQYFPTNLENMVISWPSDLTDKTAYATYDTHTGSFDGNRVPVYSRILKNSDGGYNFIYVNFHDFNGCGPAFDFEAKLYIPTGSSGLDKTLTVCPADLHAGDFEHITIKMNSSLQPVKLTYAHHDGKFEYLPSEVSWDGTHPISYISKGSHANYKQAGEIPYMTGWDKSYGGDSYCTDMCSKQVTVPYPCGVSTCSTFPYLCTKWCSSTETVEYPCVSSCFNGFKTHGWLFDYTSAGTYWRPSVRLLASDAHTISTTLSTNEEKVITFAGRFGKDIGDKTDYISPFVDSVVTMVGTLYPSAQDEVRTAAKSIMSQFDGTPVSGLQNKAWWTTCDGC